MMDDGRCTAKDLPQDIMEMFVSYSAIKNLESFGCVFQLYTCDKEKSA
jgi:hypothetical protein